jgi:hypothetical protein
MDLMASFLKFPEQGSAIGRLVVGYGELEFFYAVRRPVPSQLFLVFALSRS